MLAITQILNQPAPTTITVFVQGSRPTDDTHWLVLKLIDPPGVDKVIVKLPADSSVPGQINVSASRLTSGKPAFVSLAFTKANGTEVEGSNVASIVPQ